MVYAYHESITENFERFTDEEWAAKFGQSGERPVDVPWVTNLLAE